MQDALVAQCLGDEAGGVVGASGVGGDGVLHGAFLAEQSVQYVGQPARTVMGDEYGGDDVPWELGRGGGGRVRGR
ncbi:hypothetical protein GCM10018773_41200 [Streptomyces candidus]|nr:hypothetical protein GCM10018773_41200 [Streptomyces candidus]